ncbi:MAG: DUF423 domain-containing protein [Bacteroidota bacterium]
MIPAPHQGRLRLGAALAALAVATGAFGAHGLKTLVDASALVTWETACRYHFFHALGILIAAFLPASNARIASRFFLAGIILFSGSLYLLTFRDLVELPGILGPITPIGGLCMIIGWLALIKKSSSTT